MEETVGGAPTATGAFGKLLKVVIEVPAILALVLMMLHITANALFRTFAGNPITSTLAVTQYWYVPVIAMLGFVAAQSRGQHIAADLMLNKLPEAVRPWAVAAGQGLFAIVAVGFVIFTFQEAIENWEIGLTDGATGVSVWPVTFLVPLVFVLLSIQCAVQLVRSVRNRADQQPRRAGSDDVLA